MSAGKNKKQSGARPDKDSVSSNPMTSLVHERLDVERYDIRHKASTNYTQDGASEEAFSEPPLKRARSSDRHPESSNTAPQVSGDHHSDKDLQGVPARESLFLSEENRDDLGTHEFEIIDEVAADEEDQEEEGERDSDDSLDDTELYALLEEGITKDSISHSDRPIEREKVVLVERGHDPFDILPEGWLVVTHNSGMPVYLHRQSRVCTLAQPYFLGSGSARKHDIPISAVPCLKYRRELEKEQQPQEEQQTPQPETPVAAPPEAEKEDSQKGGSPVKDDLTSAFPSVQIKSADEMKRETSLDFLQLREYCQGLFEFKTVTVQRYK